ncbi:outer membrane lipoprotein-sorting protein [Pseudomonas syringae]|uniref:Outer membrane lipoprotein-sorting protein n=1 Tax=Pseudomonas syringae TaxID=317 RepID=A0A3T0JZN8_PSESX|nr:outer membrane lipoprotein-sorting protein [Pseudomonas syringae]
MKITKSLFHAGVLGLSLLATGVMAAVPAAEADKLGKSLTPMGAEMAGNADGSIPAWKPMPKNAGTVDSKGFLSDPYASEKPLFTITKQNVDQYKAKLAPGQYAMFQRYPETFKMPVYPSHRGATVPDSVFAAIKKNATTTNLVQGGNGLENFDTAVPFPIPKTGVEVIWNHITRYRGGSVTRLVTQATPQPNGSFSLVYFQDQFVFRDRMKDYDPANPGNILFYFKQKVTAPARLAGGVLLVHETLDQVKEPRSAWVYNAGQRRVRRAPQVSYDGPGTAADGLRTSDNLDMFNGAPDRYDWKLVGKQEMYIASDSYKLDDPKLKYADIIKAGHINQDLARYELRRVWHVTATLKEGQRHIYAKRDFFIDEDTWQAAVIDHYDGRNQLWRVAEAHAQDYYNVQVPWYTLETLYDLQSGRYLALGMKNEESRAYDFGFTATISDFSPAALRQDGIR